MLKTQTRWKVFGRNLTTDCSKPRVVVLGAGWGGFRVARDLDKNKFDVTVVSPRCDQLIIPLLIIVIMIIDMSPRSYHPPLDDGYHDHCCAAQEPLPLHPLAAIHDGGHP